MNKSTASREVEMFEEIQFHISLLYRRYPKEIFMAALKWILDPNVKYKLNTIEGKVKSKQEDKKISAAMKHKDVTGAGAKKRKSLPKKDKIKTVMKEFERGTLHSGSGKKVTNPKQAVAIGYSEAGKSKKKK